MNLLWKIATAAALVAPAAADATVAVRIDEVGSSVVVDVSGSFDTSGLSPLALFTLGTGVRGNATYVGVGPTGARVQGFGGLSGPVSIGPGTVLAPPSQTTGDAFALNINVGSPIVFFARDYVSGRALRGQAVFNNATFASLGLATGTYLFTAASDTVTLVIGGVPEPTSWAMMIGGFGLAGAALRRRAARTTVRYA